MTIWHSVICEERKQPDVPVFGWIMRMPSPLRESLIAGFMQGDPPAMFEVTREELRQLTGREPP